MKRRGGFFLSSAEALQFHIQDLGSSSLFDVGIIPLFLQQVMGVLLDKEDWEHVLATAIAELEKRPKRGSGDNTPSSRGSVRRKFSHASSISALSSAPSEPTPTNSVLSDGSGSATASRQIQELQAALKESQQVLRHSMSFFVLGLQVFLLHNIPCVRYVPPCSSCTWSSGMPRSSLDTVPWWMMGVVRGFVVFWETKKVVNRNTEHHLLR